MTQILFANAALVDAAEPERREGHHVLVEGEHIREVSDRPIKATDATTIDLAGRTLMPGLIDAHVHAIAVTTDLPALARMPPSLVTARALIILEGMLARGFTTVRDAGGAEWGLASPLEGEGRGEGWRVRAPKESFLAAFRRPPPHPPTAIAAGPSLSLVGERRSLVPQTASRPPSAHPSGGRGR